MFAKAGISVLNCVVGFDPLYCSFCVNVPWIAVPFEVICLTWPALTCRRKNGLYGTRTRELGCVARMVRKKFRARSARKNAIQPRLGRKRGTCGGAGDEPRGDGGGGLALVRRSSGVSGTAPDILPFAAHRGRRS